MHQIITKLCRKLSSTTVYITQLYMNPRGITKPKLSSFVLLLISPRICSYTPNGFATTDTFKQIDLLQPEIVFYREKHIITEYFRTSLYICPCVRNISIQFVTSREDVKYRYIRIKIVLKI